jgi:3-methyladenine DNA glycosylase AlkD
MSVDSLIGAVRSALVAAADPGRAPAMQAYMKSSMPYYGISVPDVRRACRPVFADHDLGTAVDFEDAVRRLFVEATHREERYAAVNLALQRRYRMFQTPERIPLYADLVVAGAWWDTVDEIASNLIGPILLAHPAEVRPVVRSWITDTDRWLRRTSIIVQLTFKDRTDLPLLTEAVDQNAGDTDFFIRKAIGWALRQYARTDPDWVRGFVDGRERTLSGLSKREARKHL